MSPHVVFFFFFFQILMNDLDPNFMAQFSTVAFSSSEELIDSIGIGELMPGATIDAKIFDPCGFSLNAIDKVFQQQSIPPYSPKCRQI